MIKRGLQALAVVFCFSVLISSGAFASGSWTSGTFIFGQELEVETNARGLACTDRRVRIGGPQSTTITNVCVYERLNWRYGKYWEVSGSSAQEFLVVGIGSDSGMYKVMNSGIGG